MKCRFVDLYTFVLEQDCFIFHPPFIMDLVKDDTANDKTSPSLLSKDGDTQNDTLETEKETRSTRPIDAKL